MEANLNLPVQAAGSTPIALLARGIDRIAGADELADLYEVAVEAARAVTGADGAALVLRDGKECVYMAEDAIGPLWTGQRFPIDRCVSGWAMVYRQALAIPDVDSDERVPRDGYRDTFVRSLAMAPIRSSSPIGALACYRSEVHTPSDLEISALQSLADATALALDDPSLNAFAFNDPLSGLYNRLGFFTRGTERIAAHVAAGAGVTVAYVELNALDQIGEQYGGDAVEEAIRRVSAALRSVCGTDAVIGRLGEDQFAACCSAAELPLHDPTELERGLGEATAASGWPVEMTAGIAIARAGEEADIDALVSLANTEMFERKHGHPPPPGHRAARTAERKG